MTPAKQSWILAGGFLSAVAASLCCLGPPLAVVVGAGSFAAAGWFERWRPALLAVTGVLLAVAWWLTLRARRLACQGDACASPRRGAWTLGALGFGTLAVGAVALFPQIAQTSARRPVDAATAPVSGSILRVRIPGMDCAACALGIEGTLKRVPGIRSATVRYANKEAEIVYDDTAISREAVIARFDATGFKAEPIN